MFNITTKLCSPPKNVTDVKLIKNQVIIIYNCLTKIVGITKNVHLRNHLSVKSHVQAKCTGQLNCCTCLCPNWCKVRLNVSYEVSHIYAHYSVPTHYSPNKPHIMKFKLYIKIPSIVIEMCSLLHLISARLVYEYDLLGSLSEINQTHKEEYENSSPSSSAVFISECWRPLCRYLWCM